MVARTSKCGRAMSFEGSVCCRSKCRNFPFCATTVVSFAIQVLNKLARDSALVRAMLRCYIVWQKICSFKHIGELLSEEFKT